MNEIKMGTFWKSKCEGYSMTPAFILFTVRKQCRRQSISTQRKLKCRSIWHCEENTAICFQFSNPKSTLVGASQCLRGKQSLDSWKVTWNEVPKKSNLRRGEIWRVGRQNIPACSLKGWGNNNRREADNEGAWANSLHCEIFLLSFFLCYLFLFIYFFFHFSWQGFSV